jgi:nitrogen fixation protein NifU and related proteins
MMDHQQAIAFLVDHSEHPRNYGPLTNADVSFTEGYPCCEGVLMLYVRFEREDKVEAVTREGVGGCTLCRAATSYVTMLVPGLTVEELEQLRDEDLIEQLGREVAMTRPACATAALHSLKRGIHTFHRLCWLLRISVPKRGNGQS